MAYKPDKLALCLEQLLVAAELTANTIVVDKKEKRGEHYDTDSPDHCNRGVWRRVDIEEFLRRIQRQGIVSRRVAEESLACERYFASIV